MLPFVAVSRAFKEQQRMPLFSFTILASGFVSRCCFTCIELALFKPLNKCSENPRNYSKMLRRQMENTISDRKHQDTPRKLLENTQKIIEHPTKII